MKLTKKVLKEYSGSLKSLLNFVKDKDPNVYIKNLELVEDYFSNFLEKELYPRTREIRSSKDIKECSKCKKYFNFELKGKEDEWREVIKNECVYSDAGYGDDDKYADVKYVMRFVKCPHCKAENVVDSIYLGKIPGTEKNRWGDLVESNPRRC